MTLNIFSSEVEEVIDAAFAAVSRNPSDHESALAWRTAVAMALAQGMSAGTAETHSGSGPQDRQPGGEAMRPEEVSMTKDQLSPCPEVSEAMIQAGASAYHRSEPMRVDCDERRDRMLTAIYLAMHQASSPQKGEKPICPTPSACSFHGECLTPAKPVEQAAQSSLPENREARIRRERLEAICRLIERRAPDGDDRVLLDADVADRLAADIRAALKEGASREG